MAYNTVTTLADFIPEVWSEDFLQQVEANLVMKNLVRDCTPEMYGHGKGDTVHIPIIGGFTAASKTAGTDITPQAISGNSIADVTIDQHMTVVTTLEDAANAQAFGNQAEIMKARAAYALAKKIDSDLFGLYSGLTQTVAATSDTGDNLLDHMAESVEYLENADVYGGLEMLAWAICPTLKRRLYTTNLASSDYVEKDRGEGISYGNGYVGKLFGIPAYVTSQAPSATVSSTTTYHNLLFHRDAFGIGFSIEPKIEMHYHSRAIGWDILAQTLYGYAELRDTFAVDLTITS